MSRVFLQRFRKSLQDARHEPDNSVTCRMGDCQPGSHWTARPGLLRCASRLASVLPTWRGVPGLSRSMGTARGLAANSLAAAMTCSEYHSAGDTAVVGVTTSRVRLDGRSPGVGQRVPACSTWAQRPSSSDWPPCPAADLLPVLQRPDMM
jgi:hypothetical protein